MAEDDEQVENESGESARSKLKKMILIAGGGILVASLSIGGTLFFLTRGDDSMAEDAEMSEESAEEAPQGPAMYLAMQPAFIVNYTVGARTRFLQLELSLMTREGEAIDAANAHMPLIRDRLLEVLAQQDYQSLQSAEGKEQLVSELTQAVQTIMQEKIGRPGIETVLFRSFVMQ